MAQNGLLDFLQGASNAAASNVSAPVDGLAWLLRKAGIPVPDAPIGGSDWMAKKGLTAKPQNYLAGLLGESVGGVAPIVAAAKAPQIAKGLLQVEANAAAPRTLRPEAGAIVWHGSPHKFDRFDASKIGTGEGAQAYGHGLYFAESPSVAKQYQEALSNGKFVMRDGGSYNPDNPLHFAAAELLDGTASGKKPLDVASAIRAREKSLRERKTEWASMEADKLRKAWTAIAMKPDTLPRIDLVNDGALYKVDLPDNKIAQMLDWDKPLSQQAELAERVKPLLREVIDTKPYSGGWGSLEPNPAALRELFTKQGTPLGLYSAADAQALNVPGSVVVRALGKGDKESWKASEALRKQGIPGIRYLDGGSRGAGAGTSNFVVFPGEEDALRILERNGLLAP